MKIKILYILILFYSITLSCQTISQLAVTSNKGTNYIPVYDREGTIYFSVKHFADALSVNYYYNTDTQKIVLKFKDYYLTVTAQNPYLILRSKNDNKKTVYQLPTSSYFFNDQIFIPLIYTKELLQTASGYSLHFSPPNKLLVNEQTTTNKIANRSAGTGNISNKDFNIWGIEIESKVNGTLVRVESGKRILSYNSFFKDGILTIIFRNVNVDVRKIDATKVSGLIKKVEVKNINSDAEFRFFVDHDYSTNEVLNVDHSDDILIALHNKIFVKNSLTAREKKKWDFNVIVIDPGHGGKDSGTIGIYGIKEKTINLRIALKLGKIIKEKMKDVKVVFTRKTDKFVELYKRGQIANEADGNLFISIHCNATPRKPSSTDGYEIYLLRPGKTKAAIQIAERENSVINYESDPARYKKLTAENFILVSMAQASYMKYSEDFASILNREFNKDIGIPSRGVKQAGFYVLVGASMPSVLIETGFLSNRHDAAYLNNGKDETKIAYAIFEAIKKFRTQYEKSFKTN